MISIAQLKVGTVINIDNIPFLVTWSQHSKQARGAGVMKTKMRNLKNGKVVDRTFQGNDKLSEANMQFARAQYLYKNGNFYEFMDQESFETISLDADILGKVVHFLVEGEQVDIQYFNDQPINVQVKSKMIFEVMHTEPGVKGNTAGTANKNATLSTGYIIKVPLFVEQGDKVVVNTLTGEYVERAK